MRTMSRHDLKAAVTVCAVIAVMAAPAVHAQTRPRLRQKRSPAYRSAQRILGGAALGIVGFIAGGLIGAGVDRGCDCDSPSVRGFMIGAPIGAAAGATLGVVMIR